jgi:hypothetical protein
MNNLVHAHTAFIPSYILGKPLFIAGTWNRAVHVCLCSDPGSIFFAAIVAGVFVSNRNYLIIRKVPYWNSREHAISMKMNVM